MASLLGSPDFCVPPAAAAVEAAKAYAKSRNLKSLSGGCSSATRTDAAGARGKCYVPCDPEAMRARVEQTLHALGLFPPTKRLSMATYIMARNIASEGGSGTGAEKLALGEALVNRARESGKTFEQIALWNGRYFGQQYGSNPAVASKADPKWDDIVAAEYVLAGLSFNFARGATHYFGPAAMDAGFARGNLSKNARTTLDLWYSRDDLQWVGYVPGIDIRRQIFFRRGAANPQGLAAARLAIADHSPASVMSPAECAERSVATSVFLPVLLGLGVLGGAGFLWWARRRALS